MLHEFDKQENNMDRIVVDQTKAAINALIDVEQLWIEHTPEYHLSSRELLILKKKLELVLKNVKKIYDENLEIMTAAEDEIKKMHQIREADGVTFEVTI